MRRTAAAGLLALLSVAACTSTGEEDGTSTTDTATTESSAPTGAPGIESEATDDVVGTVVRFTSGDTSVDVTIDEDSPATRDFLSMLPLTLSVEEFNGREKISYLPRELDYEDSPGSDPENGDLIYFVPWGNVGFYYNTEGIDYSDQTLHLGAYEASLNELEQLEGDDVAVAIAD